MAVDEAQWALLLGDLRAETAALLDTLGALQPAAWLTPTPAEGWDIHDQVVHLAFFDEVADVGFTDAPLFVLRSAELLAAGPDWVDRISHERRGLSPAELLAWFGRSRASILETFERIGPRARTPWFGPPMSAASSATARLMETWAHGQDICDALGVGHPATASLRHICHLGVITRGFAYALRARELPGAEVRVELEAPDGSVWEWGDPSLPDRISGQARDFAMVVTQRRNIADTGLEATPGAAWGWMSIAQAFAGSEGPGRPAGLFPKESG
ncbi:TIGR03084 family protein [Subtercola boreus]|uniref:TIGR03084 family protein n=1 Tax=Subtercola boreus TaxID=120213 RepID=A0A3E0VKI5_9MICO|nr:TIGR03084 family metal-binding protein [Subtercola boreus]RFA09998.1 TIGR03084 family protein [Subtercola boreus]TQL52856.1 uncharacterized protein (TIGR03084 family) [Subtercola boreus]